MLIALLRRRPATTEWLKDCANAPSKGVDHTSLRGMPDWCVDDYGESDDF